MNDTGNNTDKKRLLSEALIDLLKLSWQYKISVIVTNLQKTRHKFGDTGSVVEALFGETLFQTVTNWLRLE